MGIYKLHNGPMPTAAAQLPVTTGTAIKTLLQIATPATARLTIKEWGISFDGSSAAQPVKCELVETDVAATVTAAVNADITKFNTGDPNSLVTLGVSATGYTATVEGSTTATRMFDAELVSPMNQYAWQWPLGDEPIVAVSKFLRVRVTAPAAVNAIAWVKWAE